jgi:hypothetical protein
MKFAPTAREFALWAIVASFVYEIVRFNFISTELLAATLAVGGLNSLADVVAGLKKLQPDPVKEGINPAKD